MEESQGSVIKAKLSPNNDHNIENGNKSIEELLESMEKKNAIESIKNFNTEHNKEHKKKRRK